MKNTRFQLLFIFAVAVCCLSSSGCKNAPSNAASLRFSLLKADRTGLHFSNTLVPDAAFNMFNYMYFYNGAGVGAADLNRDGLTDLFFAGNQRPNAVYLNRGGLRFEDVTAAAGLTPDGAWSTGVSIVDINNDSLPDIYVCRAAQHETLKGKNQLLVCQGLRNGIPWYRDEAALYGIDFSGLSTQAAFLDFDMDGDLDMFLLNHAPSHVGRFAERRLFLDTYDSITGDRFYRRDGNRFTDITRQCGINSSAIGYGLGIAVSDVNLDGWPDIYIGNDFHENDYLYINNGKGGFVDEAALRTMHTSQYTMGVDIGDVTNDGFPEIVSMDMLPEDHYMQKRSLGEDTYDIFQMKLRFGYHPFITRNNLQLNRRNQMFSEAGLYAGIAATDWSWSCIWSDFDNDGWKDLFVSNGIPKRLNDMDWVQFISDETMQRKLNTGGLTQTDFDLINQFPEIKLPNYFFRNTGDARFSREAAEVSGDLPTFSNGAVVADLDNDGDLDVAVNNIADAAMIYENQLAEPERLRSVSLVLHGPEQNRDAIGARLVLFYDSEIRTYEHQPVHGYLSAMQGPLQAGLGQAAPDSACIIWPDRTCERLQLPPGGRAHLYWKKNLPLFHFGLITERYPPAAYPCYDIAAPAGLVFEHTENLYQEFNREPLIPQMTSTAGPALAVADVNGDGLDDVFFGSARGYKNALFLQQQDGTFALSRQPALEADSAYEDVDACFADINGDRFPDLVVASGGNEFYGNDPHCRPRAYLNNGSGQFFLKPDAFEGIFLTASAVAAEDFNGDGAADLFLGARCEPFAYGLPPKSFLLQNDGSGRFTDVSATLAPELTQAGMVKSARWSDLDNDGHNDLIISSQWQPVTVYYHQNGRYQRKPVTEGNGWWNFTLPLDANGDGKTDLLAGNLGLNTRLTATSAQPLRLYVSDMDGNGTREQILTYYNQNREVPFAGKDELQKQLPALKKQFLYAADFAKASLTELFPKPQLDRAYRLETSELANCLLLADGKGGFTLQRLPWMAQLTQYEDAATADVNGDGLQDVMLVGNFFDNTIQMGRNDADYGLLLINRGGGRFSCETLPGLILAGESRRIRSIRVGGLQAWVVARNNAPAALLTFQSPAP